MDLDHDTVEVDEEEDIFEDEDLDENLDAKTGQVFQ
jgi:hypothetical protein